MVLNRGVAQTKTFLNGIRQMLWPCTMPIGNELRRFIASPVMIIIGTCDAARLPAIGRGVGARAVDCDSVEVLFSAWQWSQTAANLRDIGRMAVTFARASDYVSYQLKGRAELLDAGPEDRDRSQRYAANIVTVLEGLGLDRKVVLPWLGDRELLVARMSVEEVYVQTPGPKAGTAVGAAT